MAESQEIEEKFWSELKSSPFVMLGVEGARDGATQPMTAQFEDEDREASCLWFFTAKDHDFTRAIGQTNKGIGVFVAKGHDVFASIRGTLTLSTDRATVDRLWNPIAAEWYEGKDDPKLVLARFDLEDAKIWQSTVGGFIRPVFNKLMGRQPESGKDEHVTEVSF
jgi:general stress protein 26